MIKIRTTCETSPCPLPLTVPTIHRAGPTLPSENDRAIAHQEYQSGSNARTRLLSVVTLPSMAYDGIDSHNTRAPLSNGYANQIR